MSPRQIWRRWLWPLGRIGPGSRLDWYLWRNIVPAFGLGITIFAALALSVGVLFDLVRQVAEAQIPLTAVLQVLLFQIPYTLTFALPMAVMLAVLTTISRLGEDGELVAFKSIGLSLYRLAAPILAFSLVISLITFTLGETVIPEFRARSDQVLQRYLRQEERVGQSRDIYYPEYGPNDQVRRLYYAKEFDGVSMRGITVVDFSQPELVQVITAAEAAWSYPRSTWTIADGVIYLVSSLGNIRDIIEFQQQQLVIPRKLEEDVLSPSQVTELSTAQARQALTLAQKDNNPILVRALNVHLQQQYAQPFVAIVFGLMGLGFGAMGQKRGAAQGFGLSVGLIFGQILLTYFSGALGFVGILTPIMAAWLPQGLGLAVAIWLIQRANR
nr:LptF/LptG family permease [Synechococcus sp. PCC 6312]